MDDWISTHTAPVVQPSARTSNGRVETCLRSREAVLRTQSAGPLAPAIEGSFPSPGHLNRDFPVEHFVPGSEGQSACGSASRTASSVLHVVGLSIVSDL